MKPHGPLLSYLRPLSAFLLLAFAGCQESPRVAELERLERKLLLLEERIAEKAASLDAASEENRIAREEARMVGELRAGFRSRLVWENSRPILKGTLRNDTLLPLSRIVIEVTLAQGPTIVARESLTATLDPILLPEAESSFSVEASPYIWGFHESGNEGGHYTFLLEQAVMANGRVFRDDFHAARGREAALNNQQKKLIALRLEHGAIHTEKTRLENGGQLNP